MTAEIVRELINGEWVTTVAQSGGGGATPTLAQVLAQGNDAGGSTIENLSAGVNPTDGANVSQAGGGGTQDLASVLAEGGDPDGNPITGPTVIDTGGVANAQTLSVSTDYNGDGLGLYVSDSGGQTQVKMYGHLVQLADENFTAMLEVNGGLNLLADLNGQSTYRIKALAAGVDPDDAATVSQLPIVTTPDLAAVLDQNNSADGGQIVDLADGINPQDAATVAQTTSGMLICRRVVSSAEILALPTPIEILAAPGAGKQIVVISHVSFFANDRAEGPVFALDYGGTPYTVNSSAFMMLTPAGGSGTANYFTFRKQEGFLDLTADAVGTSGNPSASGYCQPGVNEAIILQQVGDATPPTTGNGQMVISFPYYIANTTA